LNRCATSWRIGRIVATAPVILHFEYARTNDHDQWSPRCAKWLIALRPILGDEHSTPKSGCRFHGNGGRTARG
jgi:hypothetical protein